MTELVEHGQLFIGGEWTDPLGTGTIRVVSPHTEQVIGSVPHACEADVDRAVAAARKAFDEGPWPRLSLDERIAVVTRIKDAIAVRHEEIARSISAQNGSPYSWSVLAQALGPMMVYDAAITVARAYPYEEYRQGALGPILVRREPVGVVAAVIPWNVPQLGPLVAERQRRRSLDYIRLGQEEGAKVLTGGSRPAGLERGWYVEPTLFGDVDNSMRIAREEIFGPVVCLIPYGDEAEAVRIANDSEFGLSGSVWTGDAEHGVDFARRVRTGTFNVNTFSLDMLGPFGGYKNSGVGREFGPEGLSEYLEHKMIHLPAGYRAPGAGA
ncbi:aldehyde dehydrogenase family protein [Streptomyces goshikiensis]